MTHVYRPRIAVIGRFAESTSALRYRAVVNARALLEAVWNAGGDPFTLLPVGDVMWGERLGGFDGILLPGGGDIDPARYTKDARVESVYDVDTIQDTADLKSADYALESGMAVLAICRGLHVVNVARGGTLIQDLPVTHHNLLHDVTIERGAERFGFTENTVRASCYHHQGLDRLGQGIDAVARAADGVVEAVTIDAAGWAVGVQWHPEDTAAEDPQQAGLFEEFVRQSRRAHQIA